MNCCQTCSSERLVAIQGKCSDMFSAELINSENCREYRGYVDASLNIGEDDCIYFEYCLACGQIQGTWPLSKDNILEQEIESLEEDSDSEDDWDNEDD